MPSTRRRVFHNHTILIPPWGHENQSPNPTLNQAVSREKAPKIPMRIRTSPAAEFQSIQTRARMAGALWSRAIGAIFFVWIAFTLWVIWYRVGLYRPTLHHEFFLRWILCGIVNDTPALNHLAPRIPVPAEGAWYALPAFAAWLDSSQVYGDSFYSWFWHMATGLGGYYGLGTYLLPLVAGVLLIAWRVNRQPDGADHLRGLRLLTPRQHARQLNPYRHRLLAALNPPSAGSGIRVGSSVVPAAMQFEHFAVFGSPGSGKSTLVRQMLRQIEARGQAAIVLDVEGESTMEFYDERRGDIMLNPLDARCPYWSPWSELRDDSFAVDTAAMAASLVRGRAQTANETFFQNSTRTVIEAIFQVHERENPQALLDFVALTRDQIHEAFKGTPAYPLIDPGAEEQGAGILGTAANAIKTFAHLPQRHQTARSWSAREWSRTRQGWVFLPSREDIRDTIQVLQGTVARLPSALANECRHRQRTGMDYGR
jgi:ABC-type cobalamin/Fe3+-siderophores transport system ATPase subunit